MKDIDLSTYCSLAFGGFDTQKKSVCCNVESPISTDKYVSFNTIVNSPQIKKIQANLLAGIQDPSCHICWFSEKNELSSLRTMWTQSISQNQARYEINNPKIRRLVIFSGTMCNLACRTCGPWSSTSWWKESEIKNIGKTSNFDNKAFYRRTEIDDLCDEDYSEIKHVAILGGEPFLNLDHFKVLNKILEHGNSQNCTLSYTSNMTVDIPEKLKFIAEKFRSWGITMSIDGVGERFEYIRTLGKWNDVVRNINQIQQYREKHKWTHDCENHFNYNINTVVSALSILYLDEIEEFGNKIDCEIYYSFCRHPEYYTPSIFTDYEKTKVIDTLQKQNLPNFLGLVDYLNSFTFNQIHRDNFFKEIQFTKDYHNLDAYQYLPRLMKLLEG